MAARSAFRFQVRSFVAVKIPVSGDPSQRELRAGVSPMDALDVVEEFVDQVVSRMGSAVAEREEASSVVGSTGGDSEAKEAE